MIENNFLKNVGLFKGKIANGEKSLKGDFDRIRKNTFSKTFYFIWEYS